MNILTKAEVESTLKAGDSETWAEYLALPSDLSKASCIIRNNWGTLIGADEFVRLYRLHRHGLI
ncbi:MAG: hypothetical protein M9945_14455 [Aquamicrobium sp.]|uniref:hypothetical protein n=1 Tax=Aquamicrobium sp. TaxID=1872579 RepID=UPI00349F02E8|nr:hypothetical protein [Aquamicrobium sp.]